MTQPHPIPLKQERALRALRLRYVIVDIDPVMASKGEVYIVAAFRLMHDAASYFEQHRLSTDILVELR